MTSKNEAHPPIHRRSMVPHSWAGHPLLRPFMRMTGRTPADVGGAEGERPLMLRRVALLVLIAFGAVVGTDTMTDVLPRFGGNAMEQGLLILFGVLFAWISAGFWTGVMGVWVLLHGRDRSAVTDLLRDAPREIDASARTAVIMPICNEDVATVFAGLRATYESVAATGFVERFDFFILSDTNKPDVRAAEQAAWSEMNDALEGRGIPARIHYRWRQHRTRKKAGNVADFCRRWGADYRYMIVLDADSVMTGECLTSLVRLMELSPDAGIIQTQPRGTGGNTLHARVMQFGSRVYGPLFTAGLHFWQLGESHYWGHNAIIRIAPFIEQCALGPLPGHTSLSGDVMSHDFVEAALMRRAGWKVWIAYDLDGSYEQLPPNLLAELGRDRRWCHGNLQNSRLMFEPGLHPVHRSVFFTGVLAYASSPLWLGFLLVSSLLFTNASHTNTQYVIEPYQLFPIWPSANVKLMLALFGFTAVLLLAPKVMSLLLIIAKGQARSFGGVIRLLLSAFLEFLHSVFLAPVRMLFHTQFVLAALTGIKLDWKSPPRDDAVTTWGEATRRHGIHTLLGIAWVAAIIVTSRAFPWWLSPVIGGIVFAIPMSALLSHAGSGRWLRRHRMFLIPEEASEPQVLIEARRYAEQFSGERSFVEAVTDAQVHAQVLAALPARPPAHGAKARAQAALVDRAAREGPDALARDLRLRLLNDGEALGRLRSRVLSRDANPAWWAGRAPDAANDAMLNPPATPAMATLHRDAVAPAAH